MDLPESSQVASSSPIVSVDPRIKWIHFVLGCTVLVPWNVLITAMPFFVSRLSGSRFQGTFSSYLSIAYIVTEFIFTAYAMAISKSTSHSRQTRVTTVILLFLTLLLTISTWIPMTPETFFKFVLLNAMVQAAMQAHLQCSVVAVASLFGPEAVQAVMSGQAAVAVAVSTVQLLSAAVSLAKEKNKTLALGLSFDSAPPLEGQGWTPEETSAFMFFAFSTVFLGVSLLAHSWLLRMPVYEALVIPLERKGVVGVGVGERQALLGPEDSGEVGETTKERIWRVAKANWAYEVALAYVFVVTLAVFPPITTAIMPTNPGFHPLLFSAVHFLVFNVGDLLGRHLCSFPRLLTWSPRLLLAFSFGHTLFVPLFLACNLRLPSSPSGPAMINSDILFFLILLAFGTSNGYVSSLCLMATSSEEHNTGLRGKEDVDTAATIGVFCLVGGLAVGSIASFGIRALVCGCNPFVV